jgi:hypothetical protein
VSKDHAGAYSLVAPIEGNDPVDTHSNRMVSFPLFMLGITRATSRHARVDSKKSFSFTVCSKDVGTGVKS